MRNATARIKKNHQYCARPPPPRQACAPEVPPRLARRRAQVGHLPRPLALQQPRWSLRVAMLEGADWS